METISEDSVDIKDQDMTLSSPHLERAFGVEMVRNIRLIQI